MKLNFTNCITRRALLTIVFFFRISNTAQYSFEPKTRPKIARGVRFPIPGFFYLFFAFLIVVFSR